MKRYYPSEDERRFMKRIFEELKKTVIRDLGFKQPYIELLSTTGEEYERVGKSEVITVRICEKAGNRKPLNNVEVVSAWGHVTSFQVGNAKKRYHYLTGKDLLAIIDRTPIKHGKWVEKQEKKKPPKEYKRNTTPKELSFEEEQARRAAEYEKTFHGNYSPSRNTSRNQSNSTNNYYDYDEYMERVAYCRQYEYDFGTESTVVSDQF